MFHAGRRTDMTKLTIASRNFVNASKNESNRTTYRFIFTFLWEVQILFRLYQIRDGSTNPSTGLQYKIWPKTSPSVLEFITLHQKIFLLLQFNEKVCWTKFCSQHFDHDIHKYLKSFARDAFRKARRSSFKVIFLLQSNHNLNFKRIKIPRYRILWTSIQWFESLNAYSQPVMPNQIGVPPPPSLPPQKKKKLIIVNVPNTIHYETLCKCCRRDYSQLPKRRVY